MQINSVLTSVLVCWIWIANNAVHSLPRDKDYRRTSEVATAKDAVSAEPSCEELKAMWRFSKRQSRAAEITNEIPMYRDPFTENVWEPYYATSRSIGGMRLGRFHRPIFGRVIHKAPLLRIQDPIERKSAYEALAKMYSDPRTPEPRRRLTAFRLSGGGHVPNVDLTPQTGSFQHLKEIIRTERARELQEQRMAEEVAARAAALKELSGHMGQSGYRDLNYNYDVDGRGEDHHDSYEGHGGVLAFPDLLAPAARIEEEEAHFVPDYGYSRERPPGHSSSYFDTSSFNNDMDGLIL